MFKVLFVVALCLFVSAEAGGQVTYCSCATLEPHQIICDGYIKIIFRLVRSDDTLQRNKTALLVPGYTGNSNVYTASGDESLACVLFASGVDVWMENPRGNDFSNKHVTFSNTSKEFWDIDYTSLGRDDVTCTIDKVRDLASVDKLHYVGHSNGGAMLFIMLSTRPEYASKLETIQVMAPPLLLNTVDLLGKLGSLVFDLLYGLHVLHILQIYSVSNDYPEVTKTLLGPLYDKCMKSTCPAKVLCSSPYFLLFGVVSKHYNYTQLGQMGQIVSSEGSFKTLVHLSQQNMQISPKVSWFNYYLGNSKKYGKSSPPNYDLSVIKSPIHIWYGGSDTTAPPAGFPELKAQIPSAILHYIEDYNHLDFCFGDNAQDIIYVPITNNILASAN